jgi:hypothetical protein
VKLFLFRIVSFGRFLLHSEAQRPAFYASSRALLAIECGVTTPTDGASTTNARAMGERPKPAMELLLCDERNAAVEATRRRRRERQSR